MHIMKCQLIGGNLLITIPRSVARELGWTHHTVLALKRGTDDTLELTNLEAHLARHQRLTAHPHEPHPGTSSPTAREHGRAETWRTGG
jgi:hypothetical protein